MNYPTSVKGVLLINGHVVLVKNARDEWELPGGRAEPKEEHAQTLVREFAEELSVKVVVGEKIDGYRLRLHAGWRVQSKSKS